MKPLTLEEIISAVEGMCDRPNPPGSVTRVSTDSRSIQPGDLFIAIRGDRFDGHDFLVEAFRAGAMAAIVRSDYEPTTTTNKPSGFVESLPDNLLIRVDDPVVAMGRLARYYRRSIIGGSTSVVAVTGSNGKTTTKSMIAHVLQGRWPGKASCKSFNNAIGVPLTLLSAEPADAFVICELGTNAPGEIAALARLVEPEVVVITGVAEAHLAGLGNIEKIAAEKLSLLRYLRPDGCLVVNFDSQVLRQALERDREWSKIKRVGFGQCPDADLRLTELKVVSRNSASETLAPLHIDFVVNDRFHYRLQVPGRHNVFNALSAIGVARWFGMDHGEIAARLESFTLPPMRLETQRVGDLTLINDAYNANPASLASAVEVLVDWPAAARRVLIVGDMRELGAHSERLHRQAAEHIGRSDINFVAAVGENAKLMADTIRTVSAGAIEARAYESAASARRWLASYLKPDDTVLVKGSRALALEALVEALREWAESLERTSLSSQDAGSSNRLAM